MSKMSRLYLDLLLCTVLAGCATMPELGPGSLQQAEADLVVNFQSWNSISFIKPDLTGIVGGLSVRTKTFTRTAVVKLLRNLKTPRGFVVVVLDRRYDPDPMVADGGMDAIHKFFEELGFRRIAFQDGGAWGRSGDLPILRDTTIQPRSGALTPAQETKLVAKVAPGRCAVDWVGDNGSCQTTCSASIW